MRFVFLDNDTRMLFATAYDGDWDAYIDDFATKIPDYLDIIDSAWEGWPGIRSPEAKDYLATHQVTAEGWYVANDLTVAETRRLERIGQAVDEFLDKVGDIAMGRRGAPDRPATASERADLHAGPGHRRPRRHPGDGAALPARALLRHARDAARRRCPSRSRVPAPAGAARRLRRRVVAGPASRGSRSPSAYPGLAALGVPEDSLQQLPGGLPRGDGSARRSTARPRRQRPRALGRTVRQRTDPHRRQRLQRLRGDVAPRHGRRRGATTRDSPA